jgi:hypothetical protein
LGEKDMQNLPKKPGRPKKVVIDDTRTKEREDAGIEAAPIVEIGTSIVSITSDRNGNILGLANDGKIYRYNTLQQEWNLYQ